MKIYIECDDGRVLEASGVPDDIGEEILLGFLGIMEVNEAEKPTDIGDLANVQNVTPSIEYLLEDAIDAWHNNTGTSSSLAEWLGMPYDVWERFVAHGDVCPRGKPKVWYDGSVTWEEE